MPSLVGYDEDGNTLVGENAQDLTPEQLIRSIKRFITEGKQFVQLDTPTGLRDVRVDDLIAEMLREVARRAPILTSTNVMMGCPAMWDGTQRRRLVQAASRAGLNTTLASLVDEPVAAGIAWLAANPGTGPVRVLVFDMGGGTLDVAVLDVTGDDHYDVAVLAALGVAEAGNALDEAIAEDLEFGLAAMGIDVAYLPRPRRARARLLYAAQEAKIALSTETEIDAKLPRRDFGIASIPYSRERLNRAFADQMDRAELFVAAALRVAAVPSGSGKSARDIARIPVEDLAADVDVVVLSGGMSQIPYVSERLREIFPAHIRIVQATSAPENAVATGLPKVSAYGRTSKYRPAFDIVLEWDEGRQTRRVYEAYTPLIEPRQILQGSADLHFIRTGRDLSLPDSGKGTLRVISHALPVQASLGGADLDGFRVALSQQGFALSLYPDGRIRLTDGAAEYHGQLAGWS
nr:Hsp70 family protein [Catelliglobosispora koreensis]